MKVDLALLIEALEDHSGYTHHFLNRKTGEFIRISDMYDDSSEIEEQHARMEAEDDQWLEVEPQPSRDGFRTMEDFVAQLPDGEDKKLLDRVLGFQKPFAKFKIALADMPEIRKAWFAFQDGHMAALARAWLEAEGIQGE